MNKTVYIAGPMRGYERFNFPAFYAAEQYLRKLGYAVINPAREDEKLGFNPNSEPTPEFLSDAIVRDVASVLYRADVVALLPGWRKSVGATAEALLATWRGITTFEYETLMPIDLQNEITNNGL